jgi:hypothetical protein
MPGRKRRYRKCHEGRRCDWCGPIARVKRNEKSHGSRIAMREALAQFRGWKFRVDPLVKP